MFIHNVTTKVDGSISDAWVKWMLGEHMPALLKTNCFVRSQLLKLHGQDDTDGPTYVAQYFAESKALYNRYMEVYAWKLGRDAAGKWGDNFTTFGTLLELVE